MLYIIGTPIGNLEDITLRALNTLKNLNILIVESLQDSQKLLNHYNIRPKKIIKYNDNNKYKITKQILTILKNEDAGFITSAGTPQISDPGKYLIQQCRNNNIEVSPIPGISALTTILSINDLDFKYFTFIGFIPKKKSKIKNIITHYLTNNCAIIFFESKFRILKTLYILKDINPNIQIFIGREMTKKFETFIKGNISEVINSLQENNKNLKGEFTILITQQN